jgi:hypothetical protein
MKNLFPKREKVMTKKLSQALLAKLAKLSAEASRRGRSETPVIQSSHNPRPPQPQNCQASTTKPVQGRKLINHGCIPPGSQNLPCVQLLLPHALRLSPQRNPEDHHDQLTPETKGCVPLPSEMIHHDAMTVCPSFPAQLAETPLIFLVGRHPEHRSGKFSMKIAEYGCKRPSSLSRTWEKTDSTPSPLPSSPQLASDPEKLFMCNH